MTWNDLTVGQYQQIYKLLQSVEGKTNLDVLVELISVCEGLAIDEIDSQPYKWLLEKQKEYAFLEDMDFDKTAKSIIHTNGKRYHFVHEVEKMPAARYIEAKTFAANDLIENLHTIMASCVVPMKRKYWVWMDDKYNASKHSLYAEDMKAAKFVDVYNCVVFFCQLYAGWMVTSQAYLIKTYQQTMNLTQAQAVALVRDLTKPMAGYLTQSQLQTLSELN